MKYKDFNDYELLSYVWESNEEAGEILYKKYRPLIISIATRMYKQIQNKAGLDLRDLIQEGMVGFSYAIHNFDETNGALFYTYAKTCIERNIISTIVASQRLKHRILNESIPYSTTVERSEQIDIELFLSDNSMNPEVLLINHEKEQELMEHIYQKLTNYERQILELRMNGFTYEEIANLLDISKKKVDNSIQRIRTKLKKMTK